MVQTINISGAGIMKLTRAGSYAIHAVSHLASVPQGTSLASHTIARACGIPERFLLKVLKPLADRRILLSMKGPNGGYRLGMAADKISLASVLEAVDGPMAGAVPMAPETQRREFLLDQRLQNIWDKSAAEHRRQLERIHFSDLQGGNPDRATGKRTQRAGSGRGK